MKKCEIEEDENIDNFLTTYPFRSLYFGYPRWYCYFNPPYMMYSNRTKVNETNNDNNNNL